MTLMLQEGFNKPYPIEAAPQNEAEWLSLGDRCLQELADCRAEQGANSAALRVEVDRLKAAFEDLARPLIAQEERLLALLEQVALAVPLRGKKSRNLAFGTIGWRATNARLEVQDEAAALEWARNQDFAVATELVRKVITEKLDKKKLDARFAETGQLPDGCTVIDAAQKFYATPSEPHV